MSDAAELHVLDDPAAAVGELLAEQARRGGKIVLTGGSTVGARLRARGGAAARLERGRRLVGRRALRAARRRALELPARQAHAARPARAAARRAPDPRRARAGRGRRRVRASDRRASTLDLLLLGLGPDAHVASLFPGSPQLEERTRLVTSGPAGLEPFVDRVTLTMPALLSARRDRRPRHRRGQGGCRRARVPRRDRRGRAREPAAHRRRRRSTSTSTAAPPASRR